MALWIVGATVLTACASERKPASGSEQVLLVPPMPRVAASAASAPPVVSGPAADSAWGVPANKARDRRWELRGPRSLELMQTEVQDVERLLAQTPKSAARRAPLLRRIAEIYVELARTAQGATRAEASHKAIAAYEAILTNHQSDYGWIDEVRYYLGLEYELVGDFFNAHATQHNLIMTAPHSQLIPLAYFSIGEVLFSEGAANPTRNDLALEAYAKVLKYPLPMNTVYAEALLRLAQTHERKGNPTAAKSFLDQLLHDFPHSDAAERAKER